MMLCIVEHIIQVEKQELRHREKKRLQKTWLIKVLSFTAFWFCLIYNADRACLFKIYGCENALRMKQILVIFTMFA